MGYIKESSRISAGIFHQWIKLNFHKRNENLEKIKMRAGKNIKVDLQGDISCTCQFKIQTG